RFGNSIRIDNVVEILLFDPTFPRSARFSLAMVETSLKRIQSQGPEPSPPSTQLEELLALMRSKRSLEVIKSGLHQFLLEIQDGCAALSDEVFQRYLRTD
ncbi:MAG TPA: alpha-E domain-containing protein, partial [Candidatus Binatus sp.]|nr:alpha-E domain-containing protein [Candidatus Binatus sp.]